MPNPIKPEHGTPEQIDTAIKVAVTVASLARRPDMSLVSQSLQAVFTHESLNAWKRIRGVVKDCDCLNCCIGEYLVKNGHAVPVDEVLERAGEVAAANLLAAILMGTQPRGPFNRNN